MNGDKAQTLPYRTSGEELKVFIEAVARKRDPNQIQGLFNASANYQGTLLAAQHLGFVDQDVKLLDLGKEFLLHAEERSENLLRAILNYEPYQLILDAIFVKGNLQETTVDWIMNWWSTRGYGASQNNREEGAAAFAKLLESAGMGAYLIGRRGRPTRIEWSNDAHKKLREYAENDLKSHHSSEAVTTNQTSGSSDSLGQNTPLEMVAFPPSVSQATGFEYSTLSLALSDKRIVQLRIPPRLAKAEKDRLLKLIELMVEVDNLEEVSEV